MSQSPEVLYHHVKRFLPDKQILNPAHFKKRQRVMGQMAYRDYLFAEVNDDFDQYFKGLPSPKSPTYKFFSISWLEQEPERILSRESEKVRLLSDDDNYYGDQPYHDFEWPFSHADNFYCTSEEMQKKRKEAMLFFKRKVDLAWSKTEKYWSNIQNDHKVLLKEMIRNLVYVELLEPQLQSFRFFDQAIDVLFGSPPNDTNENDSMQSLLEVIRILKGAGEVEDVSRTWMIVLFVMNGYLPDPEKLKRDLLEWTALHRECAANEHEEKAQKKKQKTDEIFLKSKRFFSDEKYFSFSRKVQNMMQEKLSSNDLNSGRIRSITSLLSAAYYSIVRFFNPNPRFLELNKQMRKQTQDGAIKELFFQYLPEQKMDTDDEEAAFQLKTKTEKSFLVFEKIITDYIYETGPIRSSLTKTWAWEKLVVWLSDGGHQFNQDRLRVFNFIAMEFESIANMKDIDQKSVYAALCEELARQIDEGQLDHEVFIQAVFYEQSEGDWDGDLEQSKDDNLEIYKETDPVQIFANEKTLVLTHKNKALDLAVCKDLSTKLFNLQKEKQERIVSEFKRFSY